MAKETSVEVVIEGRTLKLTNLEKVLYPEVGFTKAQVIDYYTRVAPAILPHTRDHPLTLKRYPNGVDAEFFYEKNCPKHRPPWVETATVWSGGNNRDMYYCLCQDLPTLVWLAQIATLEFHTLIAVVIYGLLGWLLAKGAWLMFGEGRTASVARTDTVQTRIR